MGSSVTLPWPHKCMSPNARAHYRTVAPIRKKYRTDCAWLTKAENLYFPHLRELGAHIRVTFHAPDNRHRDIDNMLASIKSGLDGVADAIGVDDSKWAITIRRGDVVKGGAVVVEVGAPTGPEFIPFLGQVKA